MNAAGSNSDIVRFVTTNPLKFQEAQALLPLLEQYPIELVEVQSVDVSEVVAAKVEQLAAMRLPFPTLVEDTGLEIPSLGGLPGALVKFFLASLGADGIAKLVLRDGESRVPAVATSAVGALQGSRQSMWVGRTVGSIVPPAGSEFGWNSIFEPAGSSLTFGEMSSLQRLEASMRREPFLEAGLWLDELR